MEHGSTTERRPAAWKSRARQELTRTRVRPGGGFSARVRSWVRQVPGVLRQPKVVGAVGPYRLTQKIGEGGMGVVYKATRPGAPRAFAVKLLSREHSSEKDLLRFEREVRVTRMLGHPNAVCAYDSGKTCDGSPYFVMEYLDGLDLQTLVRVEGSLAPARVARVLAQVAGALAELHAFGLIHGDVKPANVVLCAADDGGDWAKLLDFGLARPIGEAGLAGAAENGEIAGTPLYLSPEALIAPERVDGRSDLYALGALGYYLLTGSPPFTGKTALDVFFQHVQAAPIPPSERRGSAIPDRLESAILSCLAKEPEKRPESAAALRAALLALADTLEHSRKLTYARVS
jgi:serine/threonine-protein kinase